jgi:hypothetical protein
MSMALNVDDLVQEMLAAAETAFGSEWKQVKAFVPTEFKKMGLQLADIADNVAKFEADPNDGYPPATGKILLQMQQRALEATLTAVTALTLVSIQNAIDAVFEVLKDGVGGILKELIP